jgi:hypothetical protein
MATKSVKREALGFIVLFSPVFAFAAGITSGTTMSDDKAVLEGLGRINLNAVTPAQKNSKPQNDEIHTEQSQAIDPTQGVQWDGVEEKSFDPELDQ